jgi:hypothetical protein
MKNNIENNRKNIERGIGGKEKKLEFECWEKILAFMEVGKQEVNFLYRNSAINITKMPACSEHDDVLTSHLTGRTRMARVRSASANGSRLRLMSSTISSS